MKQYKINIESRNYDKFTFVDVKTMNQMDTVNNINPDRKSTRLNSSHRRKSRMPSSA